MAPKKKKAPAVPKRTLQDVNDEYGALEAEWFVSKHNATTELMHLRHQLEDDNHRITTLTSWLGREKMMLSVEEAAHERKADHTRDRLSMLRCEREDDGNVLVENNAELMEALEQLEAEDAELLNLEEEILAIQDTITAANERRVTTGITTTQLEVEREKESLLLEASKHRLASTPAVVAHDVTAIGRDKFQQLRQEGQPNFNTKRLSVAVFDGTGGTCDDSCLAIALQRKHRSAEDVAVAASSLVQHPDRILAASTASGDQEVGVGANGEGGAGSLGFLSVCGAERTVPLMMGLLRQRGAALAYYGPPSVSCTITQSFLDITNRCLSDFDEDLERKVTEWLWSPILQNADITTASSQESTAAATRAIRGTVFVGSSTMVQGKVHFWLPSILTPSSTTTTEEVRDHHQRCNPGITVPLSQLWDLAVRRTPFENSFLLIDCPVGAVRFALYASPLLNQPIVFRYKSGPNPASTDEATRQERSPPSSSNGATMMEPYFLNLFTEVLSQGDTPSADGGPPPLTVISIAEGLKASLGGSSSCPLEPLTPYDPQLWELFGIPSSTLAARKWHDTVPRYLSWREQPPFPPPNTSMAAFDVASTQSASETISPAPWPSSLATGGASSPSSKVPLRIHATFCLDHTMNATAHSAADQSLQPGRQAVLDNQMLLELFIRRLRQSLQRARLTFQRRKPTAATANSTLDVNECKVRRYELHTTFLLYRPDGTGNEKASDITAEGVKSVFEYALWSFLPNLPARDLCRSAVCCLERHDDGSIHASVQLYLHGRGDIAGPLLQRALAQLCGQAAETASYNPQQNQQQEEEQVPDMTQPTTTTQNDEAAPQSSVEEEDEDTESPSPVTAKWSVAVETSTLHATFDTTFHLLPSEDPGDECAVDDTALHRPPSVLMDAFFTMRKLILMDGGLLTAPEVHHLKCHVLDVELLPTSPPPPKEEEGLAAVLRWGPTPTMPYLPLHLMSDQQIRNALASAVAGLVISLPLCSYPPPEDPTTATVGRAAIGGSFKKDEASTSLVSAMVEGGVQRLTALNHRRRVTVFVFHQPPPPPPASSTTKGNKMSRDNGGHIRRRATDRHAMVAPLPPACALHLATWSPTPHIPISAFAWSHRSAFHDYSNDTVIAHNKLLGSDLETAPSQVAYLRNSDVGTAFDALEGLVFPLLPPVL